MKAQREHWSKDGSIILKFVSLAGFAFVKIRMQTMSVQISKRLLFSTNYSLFLNLFSMRNQHAAIKKYLWKSSRLLHD